MTEIELRKFVNKNNEGQNLEYKLKSNFNEIKEMIEHIKERMHFKILKTVYAFANTEGGTLYVGIEEKKISKSESENRREKVVVGIDEYDKKVVEAILNKVTPKITKKSEIIQLKEEKRHVIKISVDKLNFSEKPQLLDGIAYYRDGDHTKAVQSFEDAPKIYQKELYYRFLLKGVERNLRKIKDERHNFVVDQFIAGLKNHIKNDNEITNHSMVQKALQQLDQINKAIINCISQSSIDKQPISDANKPIDIDKLIDEFINTYKAIIKLGV